MSDALHPSWFVRKIIHLDMDAFFASVEMRDDPALRDVPLAVGGNPKGRGVVATANYIARRYGVRSAMAMARAVKLCPALVVVRPRFAVYKDVSRQIHAIMLRYTPLVQMESLDEASLDVTAPLRGGRATAVAQELQAAILAETGLTASLGVAPNKMIAKIAADLRKPNGISVIVPDAIPAFMRTLPVARIPGVGKVTAGKLAALGIVSCGDATAYGEEALADRFGPRFAAWLARKAAGIDERLVDLERERKSIGKETTFSEDRADARELAAILDKVCQDAHGHLLAKGFLARTVTVKLKYADFTVSNRSASLPFPCDDHGILARTAQHAFRGAWRGTPLRLLGVSFHELEPAPLAGARGRWRHAELFADES